MAGLVDQYGVPVSATDAAARRTTGGMRRARLFNSTTGLGGRGDKSVGADFMPVAMQRQDAERIYQMSWTCARLVDIVVDDMFAAGRRWTGDDEGANKAMEEAEAELNVWTVLPDSIKAGRIFGTGCMLVFLEVGEDENPLDPMEIPEGGIANLVSVDRWSMSVQNWQTDRRIKGYGSPYQYRWSGRIFGSPSPFEGGGEPAVPDPATTAANVLINRDRMFRFDGVRSPLTEGWTSGPWQREWGVSIITRALDDIMRDAEMAHAAGHLVNEASVWVQKIQNFRETLARGQVEKGDISPEELAMEVNELRSIYRTLFIDAQDDAERRDVSWGGLIDVLNGQVDRLAAIGGIPITRFRGTSATGLSATGEGDARDWRITVEALRAKSIDPILDRRLDKMLARHAGLAEPPEWEWNELGDMTAKEEAEVTKLRAEAGTLVLQAGAIDEEELRERLSQDEWWGAFGEFTPSVSTELEIENARQAAEKHETDLEIAKNPPPPPPAAGGGAQPKGGG